MELTLVVWKDIVTSHGWAEGVEDITDSLHSNLVYSVGWLMEDTDEHLVLAGDSYVDDGIETINRRLAIPKGCVVSYTSMEMDDDDSVTWTAGDPL